MIANITIIIAWLSFLMSLVLFILRLRDSKKNLNVFINYKPVFYEDEKGEQILKKIQVKVSNKTNFNRSIEDVVFIVYSFYLIIPFKCRVIRFSTDNNMKVTLLKTGEVKIFNFDLDYYNSLSDQFNFDLFKRKERERNYYLGARVKYPENSSSDSKKGLRINSLIS